MSNETEQQQLWTVEDEIEASIKPCPKCGGKAVIEKFDEVVCLECGLWSGDEWESLEYAVDWWNKQPLIDDLRAQVAALKQQLSVCSEYADKVTAERDAAREWQPVIYSTFIEDQSYDESYLLVTLQGTQLEIGRDPTADGVTVNLPSDYRLCQRKEKGAA